jgi:putative oxidoreductase
MCFITPNYKKIIVATNPSQRRNSTPPKFLNQSRFVLTKAKQMQTVLLEHKEEALASKRENGGLISLTDKLKKMKRLIGYQTLNPDVAALILRLIFGGLFVRYGYMKFASYDAILPMFQDIIGIGAKLSFNLVIFAELFCGFFVLIGLLTRFTVVPIFITMAVAFFVAHKNDPFDMKAISFVLLGLSVVVFILGSGKYSVDRLLFKKRFTDSSLNEPTT